ncbi:hypothetical protein PCANC_26837, partial [Puccinia coronata f. sp. avenae]
WKRNRQTESGKRANGERRTATDKGCTDPTANLLAIDLHFTIYIPKHKGLQTALHCSIQRAHEMHANLKECSLVVDLHSTNLKEFKNLVYQSISVRSPQEDLGALVKCDSKLQHPRTVWRVGITCAAPAFRNATTIAEVGGERIYQQWCNSIHCSQTGRPYLHVRQSQAVSLLRIKQPDADVPNPTGSSIAPEASTKHVRCPQPSPRGCRTTRPKQTSPSPVDHHPSSPTPDLVKPIPGNLEEYFNFAPLSLMWLHSTLQPSAQPSTLTGLSSLHPILL